MAIPESGTEKRRKREVGNEIKKCAWTTYMDKIYMVFTMLIITYIHLLKRFTSKYTESKFKPQKCSNKQFIFQFLVKYIILKKAHFHYTLRQNFRLYLPMYGRQL